MASRQWRKFRCGNFDLVLIDLEMPEMDGITALAEIRKVHPSIPAIAFTAAVYEDMRVDLMKKGFMEVVPKPFRPRRPPQQDPKADPQSRLRPPLLPLQEFF